MALQGLAGGDLTAAIAGGLSPYLAEQVKKQVGEDNVAANAIAHAIVGGVIAELQERDAGAGAAGAAAGELISQALYPGVKREDLTETEKQKIVALSTLAAGLAGGLAGDDTAGIIAGAQSGKNAVENNSLSDDEEEKEHEHGALEMKLPRLDLGTGPLRDEHGNPIPGTAGMPLPGGTLIGKGKAKDTGIWTETNKKAPVENAYGHWEKHGKEFPEFQNSKQYVDATHNFVTSPPAGTLTKTRPNGDTLYYNPTTNTFASKDINGVPRTMFKPEKGLEYWKKQ